MTSFYQEMKENKNYAESTHSPPKPTHHNLPQKYPKFINKSPHFNPIIWAF